MKLVLPALLLSLPLSAQEALLEDFDAPGTSWTGTIFSELRLLGGSALSREALTEAMGAPDTVPPLPINAGGDAEGRMFEATVPAAHAFALTPNVPANRFADGAIGLHAAFGVTDPFGSQSFGPLLRASIDPSPPFGSGLNAYTAIVSRSPATPTMADFRIARWRDGVILASGLLAGGTFSIAPGTENYRVEFEATGTRLAARLWRITAAHGRLVVAPIALAGGTGPLGNELVAHDGELRSGRAGIDFFTRGTNSVFVDDLELKPRETRRVPGQGLGAAPGVPSWLPFPRAPLGAAWRLRELLRETGSVGALRGSSGS